MIYMWFTGKNYSINWPLRKIVTLFLRPLRPYETRLNNNLLFVTCEIEDIEISNQPSIDPFSLLSVFYGFDIV